MLPCLDSLCANCFGEVCHSYSDNLTGSAACPRCGEEFSLPTGDLQRPPGRGFIDKLVALKKIANQNMEDDNCEICKQLSSSAEPVAASKYYCIDCRQRMCDGCAKRHTLISSCKNHRIVGLGPDSAREELNRLKCFTPSCVNHEDSYATAHCYQCSVGLCSQCKIMHLGHELEELSPLSNRVKFLHDSLQQQFAACTAKTDQVQKLLSNRQRGIELAKKEINDKADKLISLIQKQRDDLLSVLRSRNEQPISSLEAVSERLSSCVSANRKALKFAEELLEKGSVEDMLLNCRMLNDRVTRLSSMSRDGSELEDSISNDVSSASLIHDASTSLNSQSEFIIGLVASMSISVCVFLRAKTKLNDQKLMSLGM